MEPWGDVSLTLETAVNILFTVNNHCWFLLTMKGIFHLLYVINLKGSSTFSVF